MVLYLKYRPQRLSELDLEQVREKLKLVLSSPYRPHAYLFAGPRGTGKTSAARIVAKILNCEHLASSEKEKKLPPKPYTLDPDKIEPCNKCLSCKAITGGSHIDILEIDAASNRGIEEIRTLREGIKLAPVSARMKVYIIDEVHMLTTEAFNALLKTLEEPPDHAVFILATTEPDKLPQTILSRVSRFNFNIAAPIEIQRCLQRVVKGEKLKVDKETLVHIAKHADGSFRDATKILEQAISQNALNKDKLRKLLGDERISNSDFLLLIANKKADQLLSEIEKMAADGTDFKLFVKDILNSLHSLLLLKYGIDNKNVDKKLKKLFSEENILQLIEIFSKAYREFRMVAVPELPVELAVISWCEK